MKIWKTKHLDGCNLIVDGLDMVDCQSFPWFNVLHAPPPLQAYTRFLLSRNEIYHSWINCFTSTGPCATAKSTFNALALLQVGLMMQYKSVINVYICQRNRERNLEYVSFITLAGGKRSWGLLWHLQRLARDLDSLMFCILLFLDMCKDWIIVLLSPLNWGIFHLNSIWNSLRPSASPSQSKISSATWESSPTSSMKKRRTPSCLRSSLTWRGCDMNLITGMMYVW